ncbi:MAG: DUF296 domain-containing protein [Actinobacteria bacterium]|nr:DUF296 domain-containing protein [Actinomycetota bacterium]
MRTKLLHRNGERTYVLVFDKDDAVIEELEGFARECELPAARFTAIGAFSYVKLGYLDRGRTGYLEISLEEQVEVLSLLGDIAEHEGQPKVHAHVVVGRRDGRTRGGHLLEAHVWPTLELMLEESPEHLRRRIDEETVPLIVL